MMCEAVELPIKHNRGNEFKKRSKAIKSRESVSSAQYQVVCSIQKHARSGFQVYGSQNTESDQEKAEREKCQAI